MAKGFVALIFVSASLLIYTSAEFFPLSTAVTVASDYCKDFSDCSKALLRFGEHILSTAMPYALNIYNAYPAMKWVWNFAMHFYMKDEVRIGDIVTYMWKDPPIPVVQYILETFIPSESLLKPLNTILKIFGLIKEDLSVTSVIKLMLEEISERYILPAIDRYKTGKKDYATS